MGPRDQSLRYSNFIYFSSHEAGDPTLNFHLQKENVLTNCCIHLLICSQFGPVPEWKYGVLLTRHEYEYGRLLSATNELGSVTVDELHQTADETARHIAQFVLVFTRSISYSKGGGIRIPKLTLHPSHAWKFL